MASSAQAELFAAAPAGAKPTTIAAVIDLLLGSLETSKGYEMMTPPRYGHACELLSSGVDPFLVAGAVSRINASRWLKKRSRAVTEEDLEAARKLAAKAGAKP